MNKRQNPYSPGAGRRPPELGGRDQLIDDAALAMDRLQDREAANSLMILGLRGVGKTVLLNVLKSIAEKKGFKTEKIEASEAGRLPEMLVPALRKILLSLDNVKKAGDLTLNAFRALRNFAAAFEVSVGEIGLSIKPAPGSADTGEIELDIPDLFVAVAKAAADKKTVVALFIDEIQYLSLEELSAIVVACHEISQENLPFFFVGAGLPQIAALSGNAKSYAERLFDYPDVKELDVEGATKALVIPAENRGVKYEEEAIRKILHHTKRYPYFIQVWGKAVWDSSPQSPIREIDVDVTTPAILDYLDANFFKVRFDRTTGNEQKLMRAMSELGVGPYQRKDIIKLLNCSDEKIAPLLSSLTHKGMIWTSEAGGISFTVPLFDGCMKRKIPDIQHLD